jgi:hypothetical protein
LDNKNEVKEKVKKVLWKMIQIPTIGFMIFASVCMAHYSTYYYKNKTLTFGINDSKILTFFLFAFIWILFFSVFLMIELHKKDKIIISQNVIIQNQNNDIKDLLQQVIQQGNSIENTTNNIKEQTNNVEEKIDNLQESIDYDIERCEEQHSELLHSNRNTQELILDNDKSDRSDRIA